ncbi:MAG: dipeptidase [Chloroflexi bacterium]|nr:dipeptidase [Chloroflexota bacterium]
MKPTATIPVFDGHNDSLLKLYRPRPGEERSFFARADHGHLDLPRAQAGGLAGGLFAVYVPPAVEQPDADLPRGATYELPLPPPLEYDYALRTALGMAATLFRLEAEAQGRLRVCRSVAAIERCLAEGTLAAVWHIEGAEMIDPALETLEVLYQAGLRSLGPVWSRPNLFGHGVPFAFPRSPDTGPGLSEAGKALVRACNRLGIMLDLSHLNAAGFWDVARLSRAPLVATHSNAHALCASTRNLTDAQLDAIRDSDGLVGVNFAVSFLRADGSNDPDTPLETVVRHIDYLVERIGIERVGLGSDFDGATIPRAIGDAAGLPALLAALRAHDLYDDAALERIAYRNWLRVLRLTWGA